MPYIQPELHSKLHARFLAMDEERQTWFSHWRDIADYFLPRRYPWLRTQREQQTSDLQNRKLLDSTSTLAITTLASGMMSGITSPARPWFRLRFSGFTEAELSPAAKIYLEEVQRRMAVAMASTNFYNALAVMYLEWCAFGTASLGVWEDYEDVFRCYNFPLGEFYIAQDSTQRVSLHGRRFCRTLEQAVDQWGLDYLSQSSQVLYRAGGANLAKQLEFIHLVMKNPGGLGVNTKFVELYWEAGVTNGTLLSVSPLYEWPCITPRWELIGNDSYGISPAMACLADVKSLQQLHLERATGLAKQIRPPLIVDQMLQSRPKSLGVGGITYAATSSQIFGAKPVFQVNLPYGEIRQDIDDLRRVIRETCKNDLFNMISQLDTVRSATEIDARREEKLIHLGPVFERFSNEGLDPLLRRVFGIMERASLLPEKPPELADVDLSVEYVSILHDAQRSSGTLAIERYLQAVGQAAGIWPEARHIPNIDQLMRDYAEGIGIKPSSLNTREQVAEVTEGEKAGAAMAQQAAVGKDLAAGAKVLSEAEVGGGMNALQALMG